MEKPRCPWAKGEIEIEYHDNEWGKPLHDDRALFEMLILEGMQAGLSWITILKKRAAMRCAFDGFDPVKIAAYDDARLKALMKEEGIIRNRRKLEAMVGNAEVFLRLRKTHGSFDHYIWSFVGHTPRQGAWQRPEEVPVYERTAEQMGAALKKEGMRFVGPTICYSFMQATGMVNDHLTTCCKYSNCQERRPIKK